MPRPSLPRSCPDFPSPFHKPRLTPERQQPSFFSTPALYDKDGCARWCQRDSLQCAAVSAIPFFGRQSQSLNVMFNTWTIYRLSCGCPSLSVLFLSSSLVQLTAEASFLSFVAVLAIYVVIGVSLTPLHASVWFDEMLRSGIFDGIKETSQGMSGGCSGDLLTSTWSV